MKKLMTILVLFALCGVAMAATGTSSAKEQYPLFDGANQNYINFKTDSEQGSSGLKYTVYGSNWSSTNGNRMGHVYFTTMSQAELDAYNAANNTNVQKVTVQFVGQQVETSGSTSKKLNITEYGIYLDENGKTKYMSFDEYNNAFELDPGQKFGVYYKGTYQNWHKEYGGYWGREHDVMATSKEGYIGNYDTGSEDQDDPDHLGMNKITVYDYNEEGVIAPKEDWTYKKFMCLFPTSTAESVHWEFMLQTRLDDPKVDVRPEDVPEDAPSGQPLPGTLATLLIGGLCAGSLRKRNKKH